MRIAFLTGIWPPDVGGPATHGPDFSRFLVERGHRVHVVTMGDGEPAERPCEVDVVSRRLPFPIRYGLVALLGARAARRADVLYASATYAAAAIASLLARRPLVAKLVSDPAYERAQRYRLFSGTLEEFQQARSRPVEVLKALRTTVLRRAVTIVVPSAYQAEIARGWGLRRRPHPRADEPGAAAAGGRGRSSSTPGTFVFVGRLTRAEGARHRDRRRRPVPDGTARSSSATGPSARSSSGARRGSAAAAGSSSAGSLSRDDALAIVAGATAALLSSDYENLPHAAVEALSVGVPVVATAVGGVPEVVHDGENGLLVAPGRPDELAAAIRRVLEEDGLRDRLAAGAKPSVAAISSEAIYGRLEALLVGGRAVSTHRVRASSSSAGRATDCRCPVAGEEMGRSRASSSTIGSSAPRQPGSPERDERFRLERPARPRRLDGVALLLRLPFRVRRELRRLPARRRRRGRSVRRRGGARRPPARRARGRR